MNKNVKITRGTDFTVRVTVYHKPLRPCTGFGRAFAAAADSNSSQIVDLSTCTDLHVDIYNKLGNRTHKAFALDESRLLIDFDEQTPSGTYGLEVTGKYASGADWRFTIAPGEFVAIVEGSESADVPSSDDIYDFTAVSLSETVSAASIQALKDATAAANTAAEDANSQTGDTKELSESVANAEAERVKAEQARAQAESYRNTAEAERVLNESKRQAAETIRESNEKDRESKPYCLYDEIEDAAEINNANYTAVQL